MKTTLKEGDIMMGEYGARIILGIDSERICFYIDHTEDRGYFYNPCHAAVTEKQMTLKYKKVGEISPTEMELLQEVLGEALRHHNNGFIAIEEGLNGNPLFNLELFTK